MKTLKNKLFIFIFALLIIFNLLSSMLLFYHLGYNLKANQFDNSLPAANLNSSTGKIQVEVLEANTNKPIDAATVCIIETRHYENTNKYGVTSLISVPILKNSNFNISLERQWGEITILVYKDGYADNINFYTSVIPGSTGVGIIVYLTPIISKDDNVITTNVEKPDDSWVKSLITLYKKH